MTHPCRSPRLPLWLPAGPLGRAAVWAVLLLAGGCASSADSEAPSSPAEDTGATTPSDTGGGQGTATPPDTGGTDTGPSDDLSPEEQLFASACARCHGADGDSGSAPPLSVFVPLLSDDRLSQVILDGTSLMPGGLVPAEDVPTLVAHLRERFP